MGSASKTRAPCPEAVRPCHPEPHAEDLKIVRGAIAGDPAMRDRLSRRLECVDRMLSARNRRAGSPLSPDDLDDLAQDVRTLVWRKLDEYRPVAALSSWVFGICEGLLRNAARRVAKRRGTPGFDFAAVPQEQPEVPLFFDEVLDCVGRLADEDARIVRLKHYENFTLAEIADQLAMNLNTVKARYVRSLRKLRECIETKRRCQETSA